MKRNMGLTLLILAPWFSLPLFAEAVDSAQDTAMAAPASATGSEAVPPETTQPETDPSETISSQTPEQYDKSFGLGACLGRGAGLFGVYAYFRPVDVIAFEAAAGSRLFLYQTNSGVSDIYWPAMGALKMQFYFSKKTVRFQTGMELGAVVAEDAGWGGEIAWIMHFRLVKNLYLDGNAGLGGFPDVKNNTINYLMRTRGGTRQSYENSDVLTTPVYFMWGAGLSYMF